MLIGVDETRPFHNQEYNIVLRRRLVDIISNVMRVGI